MFRRRRADGKNPLGGKKSAENSNMELTIPAHFRCPITLELMRDPVTLCTGITYDRQSIDTWLDNGNPTCPVTHQELKTLEQIPNHTIRRMIQDWCIENHSFGIERIPTPRVPVTSEQVSEILEGISTQSWRGEGEKCCKLVKKLDELGRESERNRLCIVATGAGRALSAAFEAFASVSVTENHASVSNTILSTITRMFPLDDEAKFHLASPASFDCLAWFLKWGTLAGRRNAVLVMKELASSGYTEELAAANASIDALVKLIKEPICQTATKASLMVLFFMTSSFQSKERITARIIDEGLVSLLLEMLVDTDKSTSEKALGVLDQIFDSELGREKAYSHALTVPVLVKKILRVTETATGFAVSSLWKLCKNYKTEGEENLMLEALKFGVFQKVLLLLQVGCGEKTKEKATELLKLLNGYRGQTECIESTDFKHVKRPF